ncbi:MAG: hypothetical protein BGP24_21980 [Lysobacterales bacterium 69-70]|nr:hypothetical protein [Xanthomonadaceae bacterium]ODU36439.1 MAG: hypothetical protein ABS97_00700 [Xanthomonadaceae bacterium SCN 69-320]ODV21785.1 MAG: hypothetical protein ABT27_04360 [Xanthomonadaceae bacterium SCN 69-25]OJY95985.1 MAG: hypothetical protein BGP24_21980 [Xanthomonadales bacterium 69-70]
MTTRDTQPAPVSREAVLSASPPDYLDHAVQLSSAVPVGFAALALLAGALLLSAWQQGRSTLRATGEIVEVQNRSTYTVRYVDDRGVTHTAAGHVANLTGISRDGLRAGERLPVLCRRGHEGSVDVGNVGGNVASTIFWIGLGLAPLLYLLFLRRRLRRHKEGYARLQRAGVATAVESVRSQAVSWGKFTRWAPVATWRDSAGRPQQTLSGPFHYDPMPVDSATVRVLADSADPAQSVIAPATLPPLEHTMRRSRAALR